MPVRGSPLCSGQRPPEAGPSVTPARLRASRFRGLNPVVPSVSEHPHRKGRSRDTVVTVWPEQTTGVCSGGHSISLPSEHSHPCSEPPSCLSELGGPWAPYFTQGYSLSFDVEITAPTWRVVRWILETRMEGVCKTVQRVYCWVMVMLGFTLPFLKCVRF